MTVAAPGDILRTFEKMLLLAIERLHITGPVFTVVTLYSLAFVVRVNDSELGKNQQADPGGHGMKSIVPGCECMYQVGEALQAVRRDKGCLAGDVIQAAGDKLSNKRQATQQSACSERRVDISWLLRRVEQERNNRYDDRRSYSAHALGDFRLGRSFRRSVSKTT